MKVLDLFCGVGGCSFGYAKAGFSIVAGVDLAKQPNYPFPFYQIDWEEGFNLFKDQVQVIHASPPCQSYSSMDALRRANGYAQKHKKLIPEVRSSLQQWASEKPDRAYVIENVRGADMVNPVKVWGSGLGLNVQRERWFECNLPLFGYPKRYIPKEEKYLMIGNSPGFGSNAPDDSGWTSCHDKEGATFEDWKRESGITWAGKPKEISLAVPPAYTEYLGYQIKSMLFN